MPSEAEPQGPVRLALFGSGRGSNALNMINYFGDRNDVDVVLVVSNKPNAGIIKHAHDHNITAALVTKHLLGKKQEMINLLTAFQVNYIILAGFLLLIPKYLVESFANRIINIHPALMPKFGGKGMYGHKVHEAVKVSGQRESGITIHFVNEAYDEGAVIFQSTVDLEESDSADDIAAKVLTLEHKYFPMVVDEVITGRRS